MWNQAEDYNNVREIRVKTTTYLGVGAIDKIDDILGQLKSEGIAARVVSMPSWELFEDQDQTYRDSVLPPAVKARVAVEQAGPLGWDRYVGQTGAKVVMSSFGASAPLAKLQEKFGFTLEHVVKQAKAQIQLQKQ